MAVTLSQEQLKTMMENAVTAAVNALNLTTPAAEETTTRSTIKRAERPEIDLGANEAQWSFFLDEWKSYKRRTSIEESQLVDELRACCSKELRKTLFDFVGSATLETIQEPTLLEKIKGSAVRARVTFSFPKIAAQRSEN